MPQLHIRRRAKNLAFKVLRRLGLYERVRDVYRFLRPPAMPGVRITPRRLLNLYTVRYQRLRGHDRLWGTPISMTLEATNICNLKCPFCFTGVGEKSRVRGAMPMDLYERLLDELAPRGWLMEFYNWGEPLLNKNIYKMVRMASDRGLMTMISTNFSVPFDEERAEALVKSGLGVLGAGLDGATQENYEKYRATGELQKCMNNLRMLKEARDRLGSKTPAICWSFHAFDHNIHEVEQARAMAAELGIDFSATKGWIEGEEWKDEGKVRFPIGIPTERCRYLWTQTVINNDGHVSPCAGSFYEEDDFGTVEAGPFRDVWNNKKFREARRLYRNRSGSDLICQDCPYTIAWEKYERHVAEGRPPPFDSGYTMNDWFNYFFQKRKGRASKTNGAVETIELEPVAGERERSS
jgi:radical SAM protein with 4Fe4S-binding SPASM domain